MLGYVGVIETGIETIVQGVWLNKETAMREMVQAINDLINYKIDFSDKKKFYKIKSQKIKEFKKNEFVKFCGEYRDYYVTLFKKEIITN